MLRSTFFHRVAAYAARSGSARRSVLPIASCVGWAAMYVGERCSIVTCAAAPGPPAMAGTSVTAVAPLPTTTTRLPA
jgi:hypothetical protein